MADRRAENKDAEKARKAVEQHLADQAFQADQSRLGRENQLTIHGFKQTPVMRPESQQEVSTRVAGTREGKAANALSGSLGLALPTLGMGGSALAMMQAVSNQQRGMHQSQQVDSGRTEWTKPAPAAPAAKGPDPTKPASDVNQLYDDARRATKPPQLSELEMLLGRPDTPPEMRASLAQKMAQQRGALEQQWSAAAAQDYERRIQAATEVGAITPEWAASGRKAWGAQPSTVGADGVPEGIRAPSTAPAAPANPMADMSDEELDADLLGAEAELARVQGGGAPDAPPAAAPAPMAQPGPAGAGPPRGPPSPLELLMSLGGMKGAPSTPQGMSQAQGVLDAVPPPDQTMGGTKARIMADPSTPSPTMTGASTMSPQAQALLAAEQAKSLQQVGRGAEVDPRNAMTPEQMGGNEREEMGRIGDPATAPAPAGGGGLLEKLKAAVGQIGGQVKEGAGKYPTDPMAGILGDAGATAFEGMAGLAGPLPGAIAFGRGVGRALDRFSPGTFRPGPAAAPAAPETGQSMVPDPATSMVPFGGNGKSVAPSMADALGRVVQRVSPQARALIEQPLSGYRSVQQQQGLIDQRRGQPNAIPVGPAVPRPGTHMMGEAVDLPLYRKDRATGQWTPVVPPQVLQEVLQAMAAEGMKQMPGDLNHFSPG